MRPAWILHRRPYQDSGLLLDCFTHEFGKVSAVARGIRRKGRGGTSGQVLQPFAPVLLDLKQGRSDLLALRSVEAAGPAIVLTGERLFSGLYINELLVRLLPRHDQYPHLFACYGHTLERLAESGDSLALREFEAELLEELGYHISFDVDHRGAPIDPAVNYHYIPTVGFSDDVPVSRAFSMTGDDVYALGRRDLHSPELERMLKQIHRITFAELLGGRPLESRRLAQAFKQGGSFNIDTGRVKDAFTDTGGLPE